MTKKNFLLPAIFFLLSAIVFNSCNEKDFEEAEDLNQVINELRGDKLRALTEGRECIICDFQDTNPEVIYCQVDGETDGSTGVIQIAEGTVVQLENITLFEQENKIQMKAICERYSNPN